jgi:hypothetical protein
MPASQAGHVGSTPIDATKFLCSCRLVRPRTLAFQAKNAGLNPAASTNFQWGVGGNWEPTSLAPRSREFDSRTLHHFCIRVVQRQNATLIRWMPKVRFLPWVPFSNARAECAERWGIGDRPPINFLLRGRLVGRCRWSHKPEPKGHRGSESHLRNQVL